MSLGNSPKLHANPYHGKVIHHSLPTGRPWRVALTGSHMNTEVKHNRAWLVLGWVTTWEHRPPWSRMEFGVGFSLTESSQNHVQTRSRCHVGPVYIHIDQSHQMCTIKNPFSIFRKSRPLCAGGIGNANTRRKKKGWRRIHGDALPGKQPDFLLQYLYLYLYLYL